MSHDQRNLIDQNLSEIIISDANLLNETQRTKPTSLATNEAIKFLTNDPEPSASLFPSYNIIDQNEQDKLIENNFQNDNLTNEEIETENLEKEESQSAKCKCEKNKKIKIDCGCSKLDIIIYPDFKSEYTVGDEFEFEIRSASINEPKLSFKTSTALITYKKVGLDRHKIIMNAKGVQKLNIVFDGDVDHKFTSKSYTFNINGIDPNLTVKIIERTLDGPTLIDTQTLLFIEDNEEIYIDLKEAFQVIPNAKNIIDVTMDVENIINYVSKDDKKYLVSLLTPGKVNVTFICTETARFIPQKRNYEINVVDKKDPLKHNYLKEFYILKNVKTTLMGLIMSSLNLQITSLDLVKNFTVLTDTKNILQRQENNSFVIKNVGKVSLLIYLDLDFKIYKNKPFVITLICEN